MSGICAVITFDGSPVAAAALDAMIDAAPHRVAFGTERWESAGVRMAQLIARDDPPDRGRPKLVYRHGLVLLADARVDNRVELISFLRRRGFLAGEPMITSDAEVILAAHRCWGDGASQRIIGDFAYLLWDGRRRRLLAARDPMAMRPLYYRIEGRRRALLASEIGQILAAPDVPRSIDERGMVATLAGPYLPADATLYEGISQLAPATQLSVEAGGTQTRRYWQPDPQRRVELSQDESVALFRATFERAVADRLVASRDAGLSLSGGLDSGSIASMAGLLRRRTSGRGVLLRAYSWAFEELPDSDERSVSNLIVRHFGLVDRPVAGDDAWPLAGYPEHGPDRDDPFIWPYQALIDRTIARAADDGGDLLMSGDRGDELLGDWVFDELGLLRTGRLWAAARDLRATSREERTNAAGVVRRHLLKPLVLHYAPQSHHLKRRWTGEQMWAPWIPHSAAQRTGLPDLVTQVRQHLRFDGYARTLRHQRLFSEHGARIATLGERRQAQHGIGFADPYADRRLIELVLAMPQWRVQRRSRRKQLMRDAMLGVMPEPARQRAGKRIPIGLYDAAFRDRSVGIVRDLLTGSRAASEGWLDKASVLAAYERYVRTGQAAHDFWWPVIGEWWLRRWWT